MVITRWRHSKWQMSSREISRNFMCSKDSWPEKATSTVPNFVSLSWILGELDIFWGSPYSNFFHVYNRQIPLKLCTEHRSMIAILYAYIEKGSVDQEKIYEQTRFARLQFKTNIGRISYTVTDTWGPSDKHKLTLIPAWISNHIPS